MHYDILVNKENAINENLYNEYILPSLVEVDYARDNDIIFTSFGIPTKKIFLEKETAINWQQLKQYINNKNIKFDICSGFLTFEQQQNKYDDYLKRNGIDLTRQSIVLPRYSEHHTGLAIDCDYFYNNNWAGMCPDENGEENDITHWIHSILHDYGFILRYPKGKENITGMKYEPWHIRYVGIDLAKYLYNNNLTLEEYYLLKTKTSKTI